jgi:hypothetical protein
MPITLTRGQIDAALPSVSIGLHQYQYIQTLAAGLTVFEGALVFRKRFNHFYRVRRAPAWQEDFYALMTAAKGTALTFRQVVERLHVSTGRYEASFASKLFATLHPASPVIDSVVLENLGLRLPTSTEAHPQRIGGIVQVHVALANDFAAFLATPMGVYLVAAFDAMYPASGITDEKKVDLVLWQTRP